MAAAAQHTQMQFIFDRYNSGSSGSIPAHSQNVLRPLGLYIIHIADRCDGESLSARTSRWSESVSQGMVSSLPLLWASLSQCRQPSATEYPLLGSLFCITHTHTHYTAHLHDTRFSISLGVKQLVCLPMLSNQFGLWLLNVSLLLQ